MNNWVTEEEASLLIWLLLGHLITDFVLQTSSQVESKYEKPWCTQFFYLHGAIAFATAFLPLYFYGVKMPCLYAAVIGISHLVIDSIKIKFDKTRTLKAYVADQIAHLFVLFSVWMYILNNWTNLEQLVSYYISDYRMMIYILGYAFLIWPVAHLIKYAIKAIVTIPGEDTKESKGNNQHAGKYIGMFERIIILTLVLLGQFDAIGFLITGKAIIRVSSKDQTEYVLAGTMLSYSIAIIVGVIINWLV